MWVYFHSGHPDVPRTDIWIVQFESPVPHRVEQGQLFVDLGNLGGTFEAAFTFDMAPNAQIGDLYVRAVVWSSACGGISHYAEDSMIILLAATEQVQHLPITLSSLTYSEDPFNRRWAVQASRPLEPAWERFDWYYAGQPVGHSIHPVFVASKNGSPDTFTAMEKMQVRVIEIKRGQYTGQSLTPWVGVAE